MDDLTVEELAAWIESGRPFILLDVREPHEFEAANLPGALHVPLRDLPHRLTDLDPSAEIAVLCHHGIRSEFVVDFLRSRGFAGARNVDGGIDAYARRVDPSVPTY